MGARRNFSRGGQNHQHFKKLTSFRRAEQTNRPFFGAPKVQTKHFTFFATFSNIGHLLRAPKARAKMLGYLVGRQHMTSFLQIAGVGASSPLALLRAPMVGAQKLKFFFRLTRSCPYEFIIFMYKEVHFSRTHKRVSILPQSSEDE